MHYDFALPVSLCELATALCRTYRQNGTPRRTENSRPPVPLDSLVYTRVRRPAALTRRSESNVARSTRARLLSERIPTATPYISSVLPEEPEHALGIIHDWIIWQFAEVRGSHIRKPPVILAIKVSP